MWVVVKWLKYIAALLEELVKQKNDGKLPDIIVKGRPDDPGGDG